MGQPRQPAGYVFVSYARDDKDSADRLQAAFEAAGIQVWRDVADLWPGQDWRSRIRHAITSETLVFIACFSASSVSRSKSFQNEEIALAVEELRRRQVAVPWLIPVRLDDCEVPDSGIGAGRTLRSIQHADLFGPQASDNLRRLIASILHILDKTPASAESSGEPVTPDKIGLLAPWPQITDPEFGIVTALPEEFAAMRSFLQHPQRDSVSGDRADYVLGVLPSRDPGRPHHVVLTMLGETGNDAASSSCANLLRSYPGVRCLLMVGIAAGVPDPNHPQRHVRLGDIVVARWGIAEYDSVREEDDGPASRRSFPPPSPLLERRARLLEANEVIGLRPWEDLLGAKVRELPGFGRPADNTDILYASDGSSDQIAHPDPAISGHRPGQPKVHRGLIASGDRSLRSARKRDAIAADHDAIAIEMEGKGIGNTGFYHGVEWFTIRGISDYGDRHVTKVWRKYASLVAAAYACALLAESPPLVSGLSRPERAAARRQGNSQRSEQAAGARATVGADIRQLEVLDCHISHSLRQPVILLADKRHGKFLAIRATPAEAVALGYAKAGLSADGDAAHSASYVLPHDLAVSGLRAAGVEVTSCEIDYAPDGTLTARVGISNGRSIAATATDAITIALRAGSPITARSSLLDQAGTANPAGHDDGALRNGPAEDEDEDFGESATLAIPAGTTQVTVTGISVTSEADEPAMLLNHHDGWSFPVRISPVEAAAIRSVLPYAQASPPTAHTFLHRSLRQAGVRLTATVLSVDDAGSVRAVLTLSNGAEARGRPGDCVAIAGLAGAPVLVTAGLLAAQAVSI